MFVKQVSAPDFSFLNKSRIEIKKEFKKIPFDQLNDKPDPQLHPEFSEGISHINLYKNRYCNIIANNATRVKIGDEERHDYINANFCLNGRVIIAQGPLADGEGYYKSHHLDFYRMLWANDCEAIAMVTDYEEEGKAKCSRYLPLDKTPKTIGEYKIKARPDESEELSTLREMGIKITRVTMKWEGQKKVLIHYHYPSWGDKKGTEAEVVAALARRLLKAHNPVIHCSAGIGRSGTVAAVMAAYERIQTGQVSDSLIPEVVESLRSERRGCVQMAAQYRTVYAALKVLVEEDQSHQSQQT